MNSDISSVAKDTTEKVEVLHSAIEKVSFSRLLFSVSLTEKVSFSRSLGYYFLFHK
jgi:hypothetical protein